MVMPKKEFVSSLSGKKYSRDELLEFFSALVSIYALQDPIRALEDKIKRKAWFEGVILAATLLESLSSTRLKVYLEGKVDPDRVDRLSFEQTIMFLFGSGIISQPTYSKMMEIREERNKLVHKVRSQYKLDPQKAERLIQRAIECFEALGYKKAQAGI
jgi:hypothetical protein